MKKLSFAVIFSFIFTAAAFADSGVISQIVIEGLQNVKHKTVISAVNQKKGKPYSAEAARDDVRSILELGFFDNVEVRFDRASGILTYEVTEKPFIEKISFRGNKEFSESKLRSQSTLKEKEFYDLAKFEETKSKILAYYRDRGFADIRIEVYPTINPENNKMTITFLITEGNKITIGGIDIEGVISFSRSKILKLMKTRPKKVFKEDIFQADLRAIEIFYKNSGFMDFKLVSSSMTFNNERTQMFIVINISEGLKYRLGDITHTGNSAINDRQLRKLVKIKTGDTFDQSKVYETMQGIYEAYSDRGFLHAMIDPEFNRGEKEGIVDINFVITENSVVYVGNIYIDGLVSTREKVIRREILVKEGNVLAAGKVRRSMERIYNLGFIESAEPQILPTGSPDIMDLVFNVTEGKPGMITAGAGYSSVDFFVGSVQFQHMNLFGLAQRLNLLWEFGSRRQNYEISWTDPWIFERNASLTLSAYNIERKRDYSTVSDAYRENRVGASARVGPRISDYVGLMFGYTYEFIRLYDIDPSVKNDIEATTDL
ncbi:MAG: outer membrane protein assembly factor BamA, partial [Firmicutes bacterium]|nr:outer membrane protein assembly factor BamA [Bacillota bacterium]